MADGQDDRDAFIGDDGSEITSSPCVLCGEPITPDTDSEEHIINNAVGGRKKTKGFLCQHDNNTTGSEWDAELAAELNGLCHIFAIQRERGEVPAETITTTAGETLVMLSDGGFKSKKPAISKVQEGTKIQLRARVRTMREARQVLEGHKRKYPSIDVEAELAKATEVETFPEGLIKVTVQIGGVRSGRSIVKSAVAFAHECGIPAKACEEAFAYLRDENAPPCYGFYQSSDLVIDRPRGTPFHCVAISGDPESGLLCGYVEYFGFLRMVVCLSRAYTGAPINRSYAIDPTTGQELHLSVRMSFAATDIEDIFEYRHCSHEATARNFHEVLGPALIRKEERDRQRWIAESVAYALKNCGAVAGERITPEQAAEASRLLQERMVEYTQNLRRPRPAPEGATFVPFRAASGEEDAG